MTDREQLSNIISHAPVGTRGLKKYYTIGSVAHRMRDILAIADHLIANGVTIQKHGRWENGRCNNCGQVDFSKPFFCPGCGAEMDVEVEDER